MYSLDHSTLAGRPALDPRPAQTHRASPGCGCAPGRRAHRAAIVAALLAAMLVLSARPGAAQTVDRSTGLYGIGPRLGVTVDPDQLHLGAHLDLGSVGSRVNLLPNVEVGLGDDFTVVTLMAELDYHFHRIGGGWRPYLGGAIGPVFVSHDRGGDDTELGITAQGGLARPNASGNTFFIELKLGLVDSPDAKITIGWTFPV